MVLAEVQVQVNGIGVEIWANRIGDGGGGGTSLAKAQFICCKFAGGVKTIEEMLAVEVAYSQGEMCSEVQSWGQGVDRVNLIVGYACISLDLVRWCQRSYRMIDFLKMLRVRWFCTLIVIGRQRGDGVWKGEDLVTGRKKRVYLTQKLQERQVGSCTEDLGKGFGDDVY